ncbi:hypothetical protein ACS0TY_014064 [Phlomoides rotata]
MVGLGGVYKLPNSTTLVWDGVVPEECQPNPLILSFSSNFTWEKAIEPLHGDGIGPGIPFARSILDSNPEVEIGLVPCASIGTNIAQWARGSDLYGKMLSRAQMAIQTAAELDNVECVDAMGRQLGPDNLHLTTASQVQLGKMLADAYLTIGNVTSTPNNS